MLNLKLKLIAIVCVAMLLVIKTKDKNIIYISQHNMLLNTTTKQYGIDQLFIRDLK